MKVAYFESAADLAKWINENPLSIDIKHAFSHGDKIVITYRINTYIESK